jgi:hypothetical protein
MPLKADDLKTVESYKKAVKQDATKLSEHGNTKFWIYKDIERQRRAAANRNSRSSFRCWTMWPRRPCSRGSNRYAGGFAGYGTSKFNSIPNKERCRMRCFSLLTRAAMVTPVAGVELLATAPAKPDWKGKKRFQGNETAGFVRLWLQTETLHRILPIAEP